MVAAEGQRKEKPTKMEQKKIQGLEWEPQVKHTALLVSQFTYGRLRGRGKKNKKRSQN